MSDHSPRESPRSPLPALNIVKPHPHLGSTQSPRPTSSTQLGEPHATISHDDTVYLDTTHSNSSSPHSSPISTYLNPSDSTPLHIIPNIMGDGASKGNIKDTNNNNNAPPSGQEPLLTHLQFDSLDSTQTNEHHCYIDESNQLRIVPRTGPTSYGIVRWFDPHKGFGFIALLPGKPVFIPPVTIFHPKHHHHQSPYPPPYTFEQQYIPIDLGEAMKVTHANSSTSWVKLKALFGFVMRGVVVDPSFNRSLADDRGYETSAFTSSTAVLTCTTRTTKAELDEQSDPKTSSSLSLSTQQQPRHFTFPPSPSNNGHLESSTPHSRFNKQASQLTHLDIPASPSLMTAPSQQLQGTTTLMPNRSVVPPFSPTSTFIQPKSSLVIQSTPLFDQETNTLLDLAEPTTEMPHSTSLFNSAQGLVCEDHGEDDILAGLVFDSLNSYARKNHPTSLHHQEQPGQKTTVVPNQDTSKFVRTYMGWSSIEDHEKSIGIVHPEPKKMSPLQELLAGQSPFSVGNEHTLPGATTNTPQTTVPHLSIDTSQANGYAENYPPISPSSLRCVPLDSFKRLITTTTSEQLILTTPRPAGFGSFQAPPAPPTQQHLAPHTPLASEITTISPLPPSPSHQPPIHHTNKVLIGPCEPPSQWHLRIPSPKNNISHPFCRAHIFAHQTHLCIRGFRRLQEGQIVEFSLVNVKGKLAAHHVTGLNLTEVNSPESVREDMRLRGPDAAAKVGLVWNDLIGAIQQYPVTIGGPIRVSQNNAASSTPLPEVNISNPAPSDVNIDVQKPVEPQGSSDVTHNHPNHEKNKGGKRKNVDNGKRIVDDYLTVKENPVRMPQSAHHGDDNDIGQPSGQQKQHSKQQKQQPQSSQKQQSQKPPKSQQQQHSNHSSNPPQPPHPQQEKKEEEEQQQQNGQLKHTELPTNANQFAPTPFKNPSQDEEDNSKNCDHHNPVPFIPPPYPNQHNPHKNISHPPPPPPPPPPSSTCPTSPNDNSDNNNNNNDPAINNPHQSLINGFNINAYNYFSSLPPPLHDRDHILSGFADVPPVAAIPITATPTASTSTLVSPNNTSLALGTNTITNRSPEPPTAAANPFFDQCLVPGLISWPSSPFEGAPHVVHPAPPFTMPGIRRGEGGDDVNNDQPPLSSMFPNLAYDPTYNYFACPNLGFFEPMFPQLNPNPLITSDQSSVPDPNNQSQVPQQQQQPPRFQPFPPTNPVLPNIDQSSNNPANPQQTNESVAHTQQSSIVLHSPVASSFTLSQHRQQLNRQNHQHQHQQNSKSTVATRNGHPNRNTPQHHNNQQPSHGEKNRNKRNQNGNNKSNRHHEEDGTNSRSRNQLNQQTQQNSTNPQNNNHYNNNNNNNNHHPNLHLSRTSSTTTPMVHHQSSYSIIQNPNQSSGTLSHHHPQQFNQKNNNKSGNGMCGLSRAEIVEMRRHSHQSIVSPSGGSNGQFHANNNNYDLNPLMIMNRNNSSFDSNNNNNNSTNNNSANNFLMYNDYSNYSTKNYPPSNSQMSSYQFNPNNHSNNTFPPQYNHPHVLNNNNNNNNNQILTLNHSSNNKSGLTEHHPHQQQQLQHILHFSHPHTQQPQPLHGLNSPQVQNIFQNGTMQQSTLSHQQQQQYHTYQNYHVEVASQSSHTSQVMCASGVGPFQSGAGSNAGVIAGVGGASSHEPSTIPFSNTTMNPGAQPTFGDGLSAATLSTHCPSNISVTQQQMQQQNHQLQYNQHPQPQIFPVHHQNQQAHLHLQQRHQGNNIPHPDAHNLPRQLQLQQQQFNTESTRVNNHNNNNNNAGNNNYHGLHPLGNQFPSQPQTQFNNNNNHHPNVISPHQQPLPHNNNNLSNVNLNLHKQTLLMGSIEHKSPSSPTAFSSVASPSLEQQQQQQQSPQPQVQQSPRVDAKLQSTLQSIFRRHSDGLVNGEPVNIDQQ